MLLWLLIIVAIVFILFLAKLNLCIEQLQDILGDVFDEDAIAKVVINQNFDKEKALNQLLHKGSFFVQSSLDTN